MMDVQQPDVATRSSSETELVEQDDQELQALMSAQVSFDNLEGLQEVLKTLLMVYNSRACGYVCRALNVILETMKRHINNQEIQTNGSACLHRIVVENKDLSFEFKRRITKALLDGMNKHITNMTVLGNGCKVISHFNLPRDVLSEHERLLDVVLRVVSQEQQDEMLKLGLGILKSLASIPDAEYKMKAADKETITIMLKIIAARISNETADVILELAWSVLVSLTDICPENCKKFLEEGGFDHFLGCLKVFSKDQFDSTSMAIVLANVSEVKDLRSVFMKDEYLQIFSDMLTNYSSFFGTSFNVVIILSNIASDGPELFTKNGIQLELRNKFLKQIVSVISEWNAEINLYMGFHSLEPFLAMLKVHHTPQVQYFGAWVVNNVVFNQPDQYFPMLENEGGLELLQKFKSENTSQKEILALANSVIESYNRYKEKVNGQQVVEMITED